MNKFKKNKQIKSVLITGISGSGGSYLTDYILENHKKVKISGLVRWHSTTSLSNLEKIINKISIYECDLNDFSSTFKVLKKVKPDAIFHLASYANVRSSFDTPTTVLNNNIIGTSNLFEAIRLLKINPIIQMCSTSEVYGQVSHKDVPIKENLIMKPASPYAVSKTTQDLLARTYFINYGMKIIITRMFSYFNPRRTDLFASSFAKQIALIENGLQNKLYHGNLNSVRTLIDVRDAMHAYWISILYCKYGEAYNIGGTTSIKVGDVLKILISKSRVKVKTEVDPKLFRPTDVTLQIPNINKFKKTTGFKPAYTFDDSIEHLLNFWRNQIKSKRIN